MWLVGMICVLLNSIQRGKTWKILCCKYVCVREIQFFSQRLVPFCRFYGHLLIFLVCEVDSERKFKNKDNNFNNNRRWSVCLLVSSLYFIKMFTENKKKSECCAAKAIFCVQIYLYIVREFLNKHFDTVNLSFL